MRSWIPPSVPWSRAYTKFLTRVIHTASVLTALPPTVHLLSVLSHRLGLTLWQQAVAAKTNEIPVLEDVLRGLVVEGRVITVDALLAQRAIAECIVQGGGDYVMVVKGNQGVTSLGPDRADPARLRCLVPQHWSIEHKSHWVRDVTFDEDRSQVRCGSIPQVMAAFRNPAIGLMRCAGETNIAAACRRFAAQPWAALALIGIIPEN